MENPPWAYLDNGRLRLGVKVESGAGLGWLSTSKSERNLLNHWDPLTRFLRVAGAPLDNNICERGLKMAIMHRKNSLSYKTQRGAQVGDLFMSLIHTCRLNGINPFEYLVALARHPTEVARSPDLWLPWNYADTLASDTS